ncbi:MULTISPECIES: STAS domain-containing protein [Bacillus]|uniref:STAS domain-containing protein n=1 Tax=Bacillus infantis TaxID=324767 RepID=A0A5D4SPB6_9BACI|nr:MULTISPECIES: STAS domain-containing protein [Bacillus]OXT14816.1 sulfate transporter [Bacillus sp. OG2]MCA1034876.1 STAS domain-containing protein [Bacillus infantis]MCK6205374.1 STAS domain-containing protein [Bacillus infantis]RYI30076.1 STAS domain-containing protein [Bacillus infantis]TYS65173.1 STAS domain-containing protein [Bacillus infantis]
MQKNQMLFEYLSNNSQRITDKWLSTRAKDKGSIYSAEADIKIERMLREQNAFTNKTVSTILLDDRSLFEKLVQEWASTVAESRADTDTPIYEVISALGKVRDTYWEFVEEFAKKNDEIVKEDILQWSLVIHSAFDILTQKFAEQYYKITRNRLRAQQDLIHQLGAPIIPIIGSIGVLPLIGDIDTERAKAILESVPLQCTEAKLSYLFIDLSGVPIVDTMVAQQIYHIVQTLDLLGIKTTISGIRPEVAMTSIQLGIDFSKINTHSTLKNALAKMGLSMKAEL